MKIPQAASNHLQQCFSVTDSECCWPVIIFDRTLNLPVVSSPDILIPFLINSALLGFCFWNAWKCDPGNIKPSREQKIQVSLATELTVFARNLLLINMGDVGLLSH